MIYKAQTNGVFLLKQAQAWVWKPFRINIPFCFPDLYQTASFSAFPRHVPLYHTSVPERTGRAAPWESLCQCIR